MRPERVTRSARLRWGACSRALAEHWGLGTLLLLSALSGCTAATGPRAGRPDALDVRVAPDVRPGRFFVLPTEGPAPLRIEAPDGTRRSVISGMRVVERVDGGLVHSSDLLLDVESVRAVELPPRLGGGYAFVGHDDGETLVWRAADWTAPLEPLGRFPFETAGIAPGFDRLHLVAEPKGLVVSVNPRDGEIMVSGAVPPAPAYGAMAFADAWLAGIETDIRGPLVTFDAGVSWHPLGTLTNAPAFSAGQAGLVVHTPRGDFQLAPSGRLELLDHGRGGHAPLPEGLSLEDIDVAGESLDQDEATRREYLGRRRYVAAIMSGVPLSDGSVLLPTSSGVDRFVRGGADLARSSDVASLTSCSAGRLGEQALFACQEGDDTSLSVATKGAPLFEVTRFEGSRVVIFGENGHVVVRGGCQSRRRDAYCIVTPPGELREVQVQGDVGVERLVALADGRAAVVVPPRIGSSPTLTLVATDAPTTRKLALGKLGRAQRELAKTGLWLDGPVEVEPGKIAVWVVGAEAFVGLSIDVASGKVTSGPLREGLLDSHFAGPRALSITPGGALLESLDGGLSWKELDVPGRLVERMRADPDDREGPAERGCTAVGCVLGDWVRFGWGTADDVAALEEAPRPDGVRPETPLYTSWNLTCEADGRATRRVLGTPPSTVGGRSASAGRRRRLSSQTSLDDLESSAFRPFLGHSAPTIPRDALGFDFGTEDQVVQVRGYAWGRRDARWERTGRWVVRAVDRFDTEPAFSSRVTVTPWADALDAARRFGSDPSHRQITRWQAHFDPGARHGVLRVQTSGDLELFSLSRDRPLTLIRDPQGLGGSRLTGVVVVDEVLYIGLMPSENAFRVAKVEGGELVLVGTYPRYAQTPTPRLVRSTGFNALGILASASGHFGPKGGGGGWFVFPVDTKSGAALPPVIVPREAVAHLPRPCSSDDDGWLVEQTISRSVARVELAETGQPLSTSDMDAQLVVREGDVCISALATQSKGGPLSADAFGAKSKSERRPLSLVINDPVQDRRFGFRCGG